MNKTQNQISLDMAKKTQLEVESSAHGTRGRQPTVAFNYLVRDRKNRGSTWVTLWLVTLANHNVTCGFLLFLSQDFFVVLYTCNIVVGNVTNVTNHNVTQILSEK